MMRLALALAVAVVACGGAQEDEAGATQAVVGAETATATSEAFPQITSAIGMVAPRPGRYAELAAPGPTRVSGVFVAAGQRVRAGEALVEFERAPFDAAAASADAALDAAQQAYARAVRLVQAGILAQKDSDQAAADLAQAKVAAVNARRSQQLATLRAPFTGVVTEMRAVLGASVDPSQPLVAVADPAALDLLFNVTPEAASRIHTGDSVTVTAGEGSDGEALGTGAVATVGGAVDSASRAVEVRARIPRPARALRIGESVFGRILTGVHPQAVAVPAAALVPAGDGYQVFVVDSAGFAHARIVTVGARTETLAEITRGLAAGETVVTAGAYGVSDGAKIVRRAP
jgi:membrane fusion protein (multidrug efflux system)